MDKWRDLSHISLSGIFPPIPTPFDASEEIDFGRLQSNLERWNKEPLSGYVVGGSNGEFVFLTLDERVEVVRQARQVAPRDRLVIAGSGMESARETIEMDMLGYYGGPVRSPLMPLANDEQETLRRILIKSGLLG